MSAHNQKAPRIIIRKYIIISMNFSPVFLYGNKLISFNSALQLIIYEKI